MNIVGNPIAGSGMRRLAALIRKESRQMLRDRSNLAIGVVLPLILILIFGYGLSLDVRNVPVAVVIDAPSAQASEIVARLDLSPYFLPRRVATMRDAEVAVRTGDVDAIVRLPMDFARALGAGRGAAQIIVNGRDANRARIIQTYLQGALIQAAAQRGGTGASGMAVVDTRLWFNDAQESMYFLVPGLIVLIMTLIGALLTALVMAREWERGTLESLFVTPVRTTEILLGKIVPYFVLGMGGLLLCLAAARFLFDVPLRGSLFLLLLGSVLYLLVALGLGLLISSAVKSQFLASQIVLVSSFMPALMLSGFLFDLHSTPIAVQIIAHVLPATWYVEMLQTLFLAGDVLPVVLRDGAVLAGFAVLLLVLARAATRKSLD